MRTPRIVLFVAAAISIALLVGLAIRSAPAGPGAPVVAAHPSTIDRGIDLAQRMSPGQLKQSIGRGDVLVLDVRDADAYLAAHIEGALHIPLSYIESEIPYLRRGKRIVAYCT